MSFTVYAFICIAAAILTAVMCGLSKSCSTSDKIIALLVAFIIALLCGENGPPSEAISFWQQAMWHGFIASLYLPASVVTVGSAIAFRAFLQPRLRRLKARFAAKH